MNRIEQPSYHIRDDSYVLYLSALAWAYARWYVVVRLQGLPFRLRHALRIGFIANAVDTVVPGHVGMTR